MQLNCPSPDSLRLGGERFCFSLSVGKQKILIQYGWHVCAPNAAGI